MCWLSETQIIIHPDPKLKADVDRLKQLVLWQIAHSNLPYNRKKLKERTNRSVSKACRNFESRYLRVLTPARPPFPSHLKSGPRQLPRADVAYRPRGRPG